MGSTFKLKTIWNTILEKMERDLAGWGKKKIYLSKEGRITFIKSTLSILPTHLLSLFPLPVSITHCIEKLQQEFLQEEIGEIKFHFG